MDASVNSNRQQNALTGRALSTFGSVEKRTVHIGKRIKEKMAEKRIRPADLIRDLKINKQSYYNYLKRPSMDTAILQRFSKVIGYNFFNEFADDPGIIETKKLERELNTCRAENGKLKDMVIDLQQRLIDDGSQPTYRGLRREQQS